MNILVLSRAVVVVAIAAASPAAFCATVTWDAGGGGGFWSIPANWSTNALPTAGDDVVMANVGGNVTVDVTTTVNSLTVHNGKLVQVGVGKVLTLNSASTVDAGGILAVNTSVITANGPLTVNGILDVFGGTLGGSGTLAVNSGGSMLVLVTANTPLVSVPTTNAGEIRYFDTGSPGPNFIFSGATLTNTGIIDIRTDQNIDPGMASPVLNNSGVIKKSLGAGSAAINFPVNNAAGGTIQAQSGTLALNNGGTVSGAYTISSGRTLFFSGGTFTTSGSPAVSGLGTLSIAGGASLAVNAGTLTMSGNPAVSGSVAIAGGTLSASSGVDVTFTNVTLSSGSITGAGTVRVSGNFNWSGGTMSGTGTTVKQAAMALSIPSPVTLNRTLQNNGTMSVSGNVGGSGTLANAGTLSATGNVTINATVNNSGQVATSGALSLAGGGTHSGGSFTVTTPGNLSFSSGAHIISGGGSIGGTGTLTFSGATITVGVPVAAGTLIVTGGTATLNDGASAGAFTMTGGTLGGSGILTLTNGGTWSGGTMGGSGTTFNPATKSLVISAPVTLSRILQNSGTLSVSGNVPGSGTIDNQGTLSATGNVTISASLNNSGQLATGGALSLAGGGTHSGTFITTAPGNLSFSSGTHSMSGGTIGGSGALTFSGATATIGVPVNVGTLSVTAGTATLNTNGFADAFTMTGGTLGGSGILTLINGGTWSGGTMSGSGTTINPATKSLGISAPVTLSSTLQNNGTMSVSGNVGGSGTIANAGTLNAAGNVTINAGVNNNGQLTTSGALSLAGGGTHNGGTFTVTTPGNLSFSSGAHTISGGAIGGTGTLTFSGASATVGVPVTTGALSVTAGAATLNANASADAFTMTGGTLGGSGILTLTNGGTWSGGTMSGSGTTINPATKSLGISAPVTLSRILQANGTLSLSGSVTGSGTIANNGTLSAVANSTIDTALDNSGQVATSALLSLFGNGAHSGTFTAAAPGVIDFSGGTQTLSGALAGTGTVRFSGAVATVSGSWSGVTIEVAGGSAAFDSNGTIPALTLSGGTLAGSGDVTVTGPSTWSGGTIAGSGDVTFDTGATVAMPGTNAVTLSRPLLNRGTINYTAVSNGMHIAGVALRNNGVFNIQSSQAITASPGTPSFVNGGSLRKLGVGTMQFGAPIANSGLVRVDSGTLQFSAGYAQAAGTTTVLAGATLQTATLSLSGGMLTGNGRVAGTVANNAIVAPGASPGTLTINGDYVQSPGGALKVELRGTAPGTQFDRLLVSGNATLGGTIDVTNPNGFTPAPGNAFQILTFGSRAGAFAVMNGLTIGGTTLQPTFSASDLQLVASQVVVADVAVGVSGPVTTVAGSKVIYTITVSNSGPDPTSAAVTATGSAGLTFSGNSGACTGSFPCNLTLGPGQSATIFSAWDIAPSVTNDVQLTVTADAAADANSSNNSASATTGIGACPIITIIAPDVMTTGEHAEARATSFSGAAYNWSIAGGSIDGAIESGQGTPGIAFTAGEAGTLRLVVNVTGAGCTLSAAFDVTVKPPPSCDGTATPLAPVDGTSTADGVVAFAWNVVENASGYRLWLQQGDAPARYVGTTLDTSLTRILPPGTYRWYVETLFDGCASHESERLSLTTLEAQDCATREAPQLSAPANDTTVTSAAVAFSWNAVPKALAYELWLAPLGGVPTLIHTTAGTSYTAVVPPGRLEWYVRAIQNGCAATESARRAFTYTPPPQCNSERPLLIAPVEGERLTSPVSFDWTSVSGATSYELYVDGVLAATTTSTNASGTAVPLASGIAAPLGERRWQVRARLAEGCGAVDSAESRLVIVAPPASCAPLGAPVLIAPGQISSGTPGRIQWSFVAGASAYVVEVSGDPRFPRDATSVSTVAARQMPFTFTNQGSAPVARYVRVHAVDTNCVQLRTGAFSQVAELFVLPRTGGEGAALLTDPTGVEYTLTIDAEFAGQTFTATPTVPWLTVTPLRGIVPAGGQILRAVANTAGLPPGTSTGSVELSTAETGGTLTTHGTLPPVKVPIPINNIPGVSTAPKSTPPPDALVIPAVANVTSVIVRYDSDISVTNTSAQVIKYEIDFVPSGATGLSEGQKTTVSLEPGATMAINDIVGTWFGGRSSTGTLEIRPLTEIDTSTSSAPVGGLANRTTFASSRTFSTTATGGTYGQYVPAVPYANFIARGSTLSLQHIAQSDRYRTNLGLVEGSGEKVLLEVRVFDAAGTKRASFNVDLNGGERAQLNGVLKEHGLALDDGRIEVEVVSGDGRVTAYASVVDSITNDPQLVPPVLLDRVGHSKWVVPGVADLAATSGNWQTDVRVFNAGTEPVDLTLAFYSMNGGPPTTRTLALAAGEVRQLDRVLSFFGLSGDAGALHLSSAAPAQIVTTARTYRQTADGAYGQFIAAVTPEEAVVVGSRPLQLLQMEQSERFKSNIGFAEVTGKPVTLEVAVFRPNAREPALLEVKLEANQFQQLGSLLTSLGLGDVYNARISVRAVAGEGRALAYGSLIDQKTGDPTYIPGQ